MVLWALLDFQFLEDSSVPHARNPQILEEFVFWDPRSIQFPEDSHILHSRGERQRAERKDPRRPGIIQVVPGRSRKPPAALGRSRKLQDAPR